MTMRLNPYINFKNTAREAMEFYRDVLGFSTVASFPGGRFLRAPDSTNDHDIAFFSIGEGAGPSMAGRSTVGLYHVAWEVGTLQDLADAAKANRPAVSIDSGWCRAQYVNGYALIDLNRLPEAQAAFERLVRLAPRNARYLNELGYIFMKQKKWQQSLDAYRRAEGAADLSPDRVDEERCLALKGVGYDLVELGDFNAAEAAYRKCLNIKPDDDDSPRELKYIEEQRKLTV